MRVLLRLAMRVGGLGLTLGCSWDELRVLRMAIQAEAVQSSSHGTSRAGAQLDPAADHRGPGCSKYFDAGRLATQVRECGIEVNYMERITQRYVFLFERARRGP